MPADVLLINASYQVLTRIPWQRAIILVVTRTAEVHEADPRQVVRSMRLCIPLPTIVRLREYVHVPHRAQDAPAVSRGRILLRDRRTCGYCGGRGDTIDHVLPQSRGGANSWDNLIACCAVCNQRKADRTPVEARMRLLWIPRDPGLRSGDQERVWLTLAEAG